MDVYSGKRVAGGVAAPRKGSSTATRDIAGSRNEATQFCNRLGCSGRLAHTKHTRNNLLERPKSLMASSRSSVSNVKKPLEEPWKKLPSKTETSSTSSSSIADESETQKIDTTSASNRGKLKLKSRDVESNKGVSLVTTTRKVYGRKWGLANQDSEIGLFDSGKRRITVKKRSTEGETSSSARGKKISGTSLDQERSTNWAACRGNGVSSVRTRRSVNGDLPTRCIHENSPSLVQCTRVTLDVPQTEICWLSAETSSSGSTLNGGSTSSDTLSSMMPVASTDRHRSGRYNVDAIANVLLALERIDQDEGLTYEQILSLETNSLLGGLNLYDQHRDMRLDIDNMSYEELLALEERMGIVSTALSEEELSKCLRISIYKSLHMKESRTRGGWCLDDTKCSICQEEFIAGDKIGRMGCDHGYHATCIDQWLRLKNWCPICKASAKPSVSW